MKNRIVQLFKNREYGLLKDSVMVSCAEPEAGDPQDLM